MNIDFINQHRIRIVSIIFCCIEHFVRLNEIDYVAAKHTMHISWSLDGRFLAYKIPYLPFL